jgi:hypothetical protein
MMTRNQWRPGPKDNSRDDDRRPMGPGVGGQPRMNYRGYGPKGYMRSDRRIEEDMNDRLTEDSQVDASEIEASVQDGEVTLSGTVDSKAARRRAEDIADEVSGVSYIQNNLRVRQQGGAGPAHASKSSLAAASEATSGRSAVEDIGNANIGRGASGGVTDRGVLTSGSTGRVTNP